MAKNDDKFRAGMRRREKVLTTDTRAPKQASRAGKKTVIAYTDKELHRSLRDIAYDEDMTLQDAFVEALRDWVDKKRA